MTGKTHDTDATQNRSWDVRNQYHQCQKLIQAFQEMKKLINILKKLYEETKPARTSFPGRKKTDIRFVL